MTPELVGTFIPIVAITLGIGIGALAIWCSVRAVRASRPGWWIVGAGALAGLATLTRVDGMLLAVAPATAWWLRSWWGRCSGPVAVAVGLAAATIAYFAGPVAETGLGLIESVDQFTNIGRAAQADASALRS